MDDKLIVGHARSNVTGVRSDGLPLKAEPMVTEAEARRREREAFIRGVVESHVAFPVDNGWKEWAECEANREYPEVK